MLDFWSELPPWLRLTTAFGLMIGGALIAYFANWRLGLLMLGIGFILAVIGGPTKSEKNGYRF